MRPQGWESVLAAHIANARSRPFVWGEHDCVLWCADWVRKVTDRDPAADCRGQYSSEADARLALNALGCSTPAELADRHLPQIPVAHAKRGDVVLHPVTGGLGICDGVHAYFLTERGVTRIEFTRCPRAWGVG